MGRGTAHFREKDVARAVHALRKAGEHVSGVRFDPEGGFTVIVGSNEGTAENMNPWDQAVADLEGEAKNR